MYLKSLLQLSSLLFILQLTPTLGEFIGVGNCPTVTTVNGNLAGTWFEQRRYPSLFSENLRCPAYTFGPAAGALNSLNINAIHKVTGRAFNINARLIPTPTGSTSTYAVQYNNLNFLQNNFQQSFRIIGFTAANFCVLFSCRSFGFFYYAQVIILTAARVPNTADVNTATNIVRTTNLPVWLLRTTDQSFC